MIDSQPFVQKLILYHLSVSASVAQLDARPTSDQEVACSTPAEVGNIREMSSIYSTVILSLPLIQEG